MTISESNINGLFDENYTLKPPWLHKNNFLSLIGVDQPSEEDFDSVGKNMLPERGIEIFHAEFGSRFEVELAQTTPQAWKKFYQFSYEECLISNQATQLFIWIPSHHEFHVVFGEKKLMKYIHEDNDFLNNRNFTEYLILNKFSPKRYLFLKDAYDVYHFPTDGA